VVPDRLGEIESQISQLAEQVREMQTRLARLEQAPPVEAVASLGLSAAGPDREAQADDWTVLPATAGLVGRTLVVLGGAYLIRAITDAHLVPSGAGVTLGLAYAGWWTVRADRTARGGDHASGSFHALASGLIALPLVWETTARFGLLGPRAALLALVAYLAGGLFVARHRALDAAAALLTLMALATVVALLASTHDLLATTCALLVMALGVEMLAPESRWGALQWPTALVLDAVTLTTVALVARPMGLPEGYVPITVRSAYLVALALPTLYLVSLAIHSLLRARQVAAFEMTQVPLALLLGFGGAWRLATAQGLSPVGLGAAILVLGVLCYAAAFLFAERRAGQARNFYFYGTAACALMLVGAGAVLAGPPLVIAGCSLALAAALAGRQLERTTLALHGALYLLVTALWTGLLDGSIRALLAAAASPSAGWSLAPAFVSASWAVYAIVASAQPSPPVAWWRRLAPLLAAFVMAVGTAGILADTLMRGLGRLALTGGGMEAPIGTAILALVAFSAAWAGGRWALPELGWLVHPILVLGGLKLIAMDLPEGRPAALFVSFVLYGAALSLAPRLLRPRT
jgi:hypothetical protein